MGIVNKTQHLPKPFQRPGIQLEGAHGKSWQTLAAGDIPPGAIVKGNGRGLLATVELVDPDDNLRYRFTYQNGNQEYLHPWVALEAFTEERAAK